MEEAERRGWQVEQVAAMGGHLNLGRTATGALLSGGISLLFGGSRTNSKVLVRFTRVRKEGHRGLRQGLG